ncbi:response regulator receiver domain protein [Corynebacterium sp. CMW7794]|uniref:response regulator transcription factor n=1 Tax=Corynebacterium TaxID=1716 RepID=UPI00079613D9|nr:MULTISPECIES: response regulator transcription factor [Corynebacterium]KXB56738.1 response regulator receiver domain protein [Corynebacterium sp. DNF00584]KXI18896.1 response regulator receiver domain protein [Corynebacterium sp. CMW7794]MBF9011645.1 response regulator transcription factor [Corynebacterium phoceense]MCQ9346346.1 response regulator transcription factor [Corynebacterium phoceense]OFL78184.1 DNA-binding response regulator [Corynebacterium sp. HMSC077B05]
MIKVAIADDEALVAQSLATLLGLEDDIEVVRTACSGRELIDWCAVHPIDVAVLDLQMPGLDGIDTAAQLSDAAVLIVTSHPRPQALKRALAANVLGFVPKTSSAEQFALAIRTVAQGKRFLDPEVAALAISAGESPLTDSEARVLDAAGTGASVADIAAQVCLAAGTTRNYLSSAMAKTGAQNRFEAYTVARERGWI